jgi:putative thiamine transport system substrate-binding protein
LPNWGLVDTVGKPSTVIDFTERTEGYESPWGLAQITFFHDAARLPSPPRTLPALLEWARSRPGRFTYPAPPDFVGVTFLKQALHDLMADRALLTREVNDAAFETVTAPLWAWLDTLHPLLWRQGKAFPPDYPSLRQLLEDQETDLAFGFNPAEAAGSVIAGRLPPTTRAYVLDTGTIQNSHFVAIPFNARAKAAALVTADFLLSPEAQSRKADPSVWGDPSVLALDRLTPADRARFEALPQAAALPPAADLGRNIPEPHGSWHLALESAWRRRYAT